MEDVIFLFLYHKLDAITHRHFEMLQALHPRDPVVPVGYQFKNSMVLPGTVDVALDWDYGWPIGNVWPEVDKIYLRWFLRPNRSRARRYVFFEYDILPKAPARAFFGDAWNADAAAADVKLPESDPAWAWWQHGSRLGESYPFRQGLTPLSGQLWSDDALRRVAQERRFQDCYCELRMGTLARLLGLNCVRIPGAQRTISWRAEDIQVTDDPTWFHPVKE